MAQEKVILFAGQRHRHMECMQNFTTHGSTKLSEVGNNRDCNREVPKHSILTITGIPEGEGASN